MEEKIGVLFVCLGNICRSPLAEAVFAAHVEKAGIAYRFDIDSAGTSSYHLGDSPDARTVRSARRRGVVVDHSARQIDTADLRRFHYIIAMDTENLRRTRRLADGRYPDANIRLLRSFDPESTPDAEVPDPYFGGPGGFDEVHDLVERACAGLLEHIRRTHDV